MQQLANEWEIIQRAQNGDEEAFETLIVFYSPLLFHLVIRMARDSSAAEEIIQEAFWRTWRSLYRYHNDQPFFPYLATIAQNVLKDQWRKERRVESKGLDPDFDRKAPPEADIETLVEEREMRLDLIGAIRQLPPAYRAAVTLRYGAELRYEEIAQILQAPVNTIRTHLHRAKIILKRTIEEKERFVFSHE